MVLRLQVMWRVNWRERSRLLPLLRNEMVFNSIALCTYMKCYSGHAKSITNRNSQQRSLALQYMDNSQQRSLALQYMDNSIFGLCRKQEKKKKMSSDQIAKGEELEKQAEKKLNSRWAFFGSKHEDAADFYEKAANFYKLGKAWDQAGAVYVKLAECYLKLDSKHEAANAYADAGHCYKKTNTTECITRLEQSLDIFMEIGRLSMSARYCKEIAELYEQVQNFEQAMVYYDKAADLYQGEEVSSSANQCRLRIAQYSAEFEQYQKAIEIYEDIARQSVNNNLLRHGARGHLLNAGICQLCKNDVVAITNALEKYQDIDPTFGGTREYRLLADLAASIDEEDIDKFTEAIKEFDSITKLDALKTTLLLRVKDMLKAKELEEDDLT